MSTIYLVRHAKPAATWGEAIDPGLDATGVEQAEQTAQALQNLSADLYTSPLQRCIETASPLAKLWNTTARVLAPVAEIPSPPLATEARRQWLANGMQGTWSQLQATAPDGSPDFSEWRRTLLKTIQALTTDSVIYTHYVAINVIVGAAQGHDRVISFKPGHASVTTIEISSAKIAIIKLGREVEANTNILLGR